MGLADEVRAQPRRMSRDRLVALLGPEDAAELDELLADPTITAQAIWKALKARGIVISNRTIAFWCVQARSG